MVSDGMCAEVASSGSGQIESESESESERESWHHPDLLVSLRSCTEAQQRFLRSAFHSSFMSAGDKRKFIEKIQTWAKEKFCGSGDPEVEDAVDCIDFFESTFGEQLSVFAKLLQDVSARVEALDTSFLRDPGITHVPQTPAEGDTHTHTHSSLLHGCLGFGRRIPSRGSPK